MWRIYQAISNRRPDEAYAAALDPVLAARRVAKALLAADQTEDSESRS
jgi:hypothetical protein